MAEIEVKAPNCPSCDKPMEYDEGQPMGYDQPDIQPEWFCECGETILAESLT